jgi:hypothetical protein
MNSERTGKLVKKGESSKFKYFKKLDGGSDSILKWSFHEHRTYFIRNHLTEENGENLFFGGMHTISIICKRITKTTKGNRKENSGSTAPIPYESSFQRGEATGRKLRGMPPPYR